MKKLLQNRLVLAGTFTAIFLCLASAFAPLWTNQCTHRLTETEVNILVPLMAGDSEEKMVSMRGLLSKRYVPCGVGDVSTEEKERIANHYAGLFDDQLYLLPLPALRMDLDYTHIKGSTNVYYFQAYTFFYIPAFCVRSVAPGRLLQFYDFTCPVIQESFTQ